jgi:hypothetical protein
MWLCSQRNLKPHERFFIPNYRFYRTDRFPRKKGGTAIAVRKGIPHSHVDLFLLVSIETTGVSILIGNREMLLAALCKSPGHAWNDADISRYWEVI